MVGLGSLLILYLVDCKSQIGRRILATLCSLSSWEYARLQRILYILLQSFMFVLRLLLALVLFLELLLVA